MTRIHITPGGAAEAGAVVPGLADDTPGGGVVPVNNATVTGKDGPVTPVLTDGTAKTTDSVEAINIGGLSTKKPTWRNAKSEQTSKI